MIRARLSDLNDPIINIPIVTPFDDDDRVDHGALAGNVERWMGTAARGFLIGSATGEEWFLSEQEKIEMVRTVRGVVDAERIVLGGIDCPSVTETLRRAEAFGAAGADMVRVRIPRYESAVEPYFEQLLPRSPLPVLLMHQCNPERFGLVGEPAAAPEVIGRLSRMENVFGYVTDHDVRFEARVKRAFADDRRFWICNGSIILYGTMIGCNGTTTAFANVWPDALDKLLRLGMAGKHGEGRPLQDHVQRIDAVMLRYGAAGVKAALNLLGYQGTRPRQPIAPMPPNEVARLERAMREAELLA